MSSDGEKRDLDHAVHVWPSWKVMTSWIEANRALFAGSTVVELGAGVAGLVGQHAVSAGARRAVLTDQNDNKVLSLLESNIARNPECFHVTSLDWSSTADANRVMDELESADTKKGTTEEAGGVDWLLGSDVFYDPRVFDPLADTIAAFIQRNPKLQVLIGYEQRSDNWSLEVPLLLRGLSASLVHISHPEPGHTVELLLIYRTPPPEAPFFIVGVEGGATQASYMLLPIPSSTSGEGEPALLEGRQISRVAHGLNMFLNGVEATADQLAADLRIIKKKHGIVGPFKTLGLGFSGAEDAAENARFVAYLMEQHGDLTQDVFLESDSIATLCSVCEENGGAVLIAGTGSSCRILLRDGSTRAVGGWGHVLNDDGSAFTTAQLALNLLFDGADGIWRGDEQLRLGLEACGAIPAPSIVCTPSSTGKQVPDILQPMFEVTTEMFGASRLTDLLKPLYGTTFNKAAISQLTGRLAERIPHDPIVRTLFWNAGFQLGRMLGVALGKLTKEDLQHESNLDILIIGSVFKSWKMMKPGFTAALSANSAAVSVSGIRCLSLFRVETEAMVGAALLAARRVGLEIPHKGLADSTPADVIHLQ